jgi:hypothetical protein
MEFLDINLTKDSGPLLHAVHSRSTGFYRNQTLFRERILGHQFDRRLVSFAPCYSQSLLLAYFTENQTIFIGEILGHHFGRRLVYFAPCYSQFLLLADFTENRILFCFKNTCKKNSRTKKTRVYS